LGSWALPPYRAAAGVDGTYLVTLGEFRVWCLAGQTRVVTAVYGRVSRTVSINCTAVARPTVPVDYALRVDGRFAVARRRRTASSGAACPGLLVLAALGRCALV